MLEILQYIFSSFWIFIGFVIILCLILEVISISFNNILKTIIVVNKNNKINDIDKNSDVKDDK